MVVAGIYFQEAGRQFVGRVVIRDFYDSPETGQERVEIDFEF